jgi:hypothetical protein
MSDDKNTPPPAITPAKAASSKPASKRVTAESEEVRKMKIRFDFWKWFCGTFIIGAFTAISTQIIKVHQLQLETRKEESAYLQPLLTQYLTLIGSNELKYNRCAEMCKFLSLTMLLILNSVESGSKIVQ